MSFSKVCLIPVPLTAEWTRSPTLTSFTHTVVCFHSVQLEASGLRSSKQHLLSLLSFYLVRPQPIQIDILTLLGRGGGDVREKRSPQRIYAAPLAFKIDVAWSCSFCCGNKGQIMDMCAHTFCCLYVFGTLFEQAKWRPTGSISAVYY